MYLTKQHLLNLMDIGMMTSESKRSQKLNFLEHYRFVTYLRIHEVYIQNNERKVI